MKDKNAVIKGFLLIIFGTLGASIVLQMLFPYPYGLISSIIADGALIFFGARLIIKGAKR